MKISELRNKNAERLKKKKKIKINLIGKSIVGYLQSRCPMGSTR